MLFCQARAYHTVLQSKINTEKPFAHTETSHAVSIALDMPPGEHFQRLEPEQADYSSSQAPGQFQQGERREIEQGAHAGNIEHEPQQEKRAATDPPQGGIAWTQGCQDQTRVRAVGQGSG